MFSADLGGVAASSTPSSNDPPFQKVALLLNGDGTNGAQNNTFVDYSYPGGYAVSFDGSGDYLALANNTALSFGTGDFTVEAWVNTTTKTNYQSICSSYGSTSQTGFFLLLNSSGFVIAGVNAITFITGTIDVCNGAWNHIAYTRASGVTKIWVNGVLNGTLTSTDAANSTDGLYIGSEPGTYITRYFNGYISNLRVVKGTALYTSNFTPSNLPLTAVSGTSLLTCQSATIVDNSPNAFTITANGNAAAVSSKTITRAGNVAQGTFSPFSLAEGQWSNYFDGNGDDLRADSNTAFAIGTGNFTFECWLNPANWSSGTFAPIFVAAANGGLWVGKNGSNFVVRAFNVADQLQYATLPTVGAWTHIVAVRSGTTLSLYYNGNRVATTTNSYNFAQAAIAVGSDRQTVSAAYYTGYISNLRLVKDTAVYDPTQATITVTTAPLTAISGTSLLTCQSNRFKDNSSNNFTITSTGDAKVTAFSPFAPSAAYSASTNGGSGYFDGSGDYLTIPYSTTTFDWWTSDFTIEAWVYPTTLTGWVYLVNQPSLVGNMDPNSSINYWSFGPYIGNTVRFYYWNGSQNAVTSTATINLNQWNHIAMTKTSSGITLWVNGVGNTPTVISGTPQSSASYTLTVGQYNSTSINGYVSNVRVVKGTALYTSNFTPSTSPLTAVTNTQLLLNCTNAGIIDNAGKNDIETVGNAQVSTSVKKYGTGSMYFDGTGDALVMPINPLLLFGTEDFTIESWVYPTTTGTNRRIFSCGGAGSTSASVQITSSDVIQLYIVNGGVNVVYMTTAGYTIPANSWTHIAITRSGSTFRIFKNGVLAATASGSNTYPPLTSPVYISTYDGTNEPFAGYLDGYRITKGQALYTSNFTPPTQAFPNV